MIGMDRITGGALGDEDHIAQSIADILTTPLGTRVMRRDYGSLLFDLIDRPLNAATRLLCINAVALAIARWEPRFRLSKVIFDGDVAGGQGAVTMVGTLIDAPAPNALTTLSIPLSRPTALAA